jgi:hypothetical protein
VKFLWYAGLSAVLVLVALLAWSPALPGVWHDDGVYLLLAKAIAQGQGLHYAGVVGTPPAPKFPPLYPLVLSGVWSAFPEFPESAPLFQVLNISLVILAGVCFLAFSHRNLGLGIREALLVTTIAWVSVETWRPTVIPLSEPLFLATLILALWSGSSMERAGGTAATAAFCLAATAASYTRSAGVVLWVGAALTFVSRRRLGAAAAVVAVGTAVLAPWFLWAEWAARRIPGGLRDILGPYGSWLLQGSLGNPAAFGRDLANALAALSSGMGAILLPGIPGDWRVVVGTVLVFPLALTGSLILWRRSRLVVLSLVFYLGLLLLWPYRASRLLMPMIPILVLIVTLGLERTIDRAGGRRVLRVAAVLVAGCWGLWFAGRSLAGLRRGEHDGGYRIRSEALVRGTEAVLTATPQDAVVGAPELWAALHLYTGRTVAPSAPFVPLAAEGPSWGTPVQQYRLWSEAGLEYLLVEHGGKVHGPALDRMDAECPGGAVELLATLPGAFVVRLNWDDECRGRLMGAWKSSPLDLSLP